MRALGSRILHKRPNILLKIKPKGFKTRNSLLKITSIPISLCALHIRPDLSTSSTTILVKPIDKNTFFKDLADLLLRLFNSVLVFFRGLTIFIIFFPTIITSPLLFSKGGSEFWIELLIGCSEVAGPVYVKLCQWASTRRDLFPSLICDRLSRLQKSASTHSWRHTFNELQECYGGKYDQVFIRFDHEPIGSGCCAQVYRACILEEGRELEVAVKVVHPGLQQQFNRDLVVMSSVSSFLAWLFPSLAWLNLQKSVEEFGLLMTGQIDLLKEAENLEIFRQNFANNKRITFPRPIHDLSSSSVLVETWEQGQTITDFLSNTRTESGEGDEAAIAELGVDMLLKMVFTDNYWHGDLHPGNILVKQTNQAPCLIILDAGISSALSAADSRTLALTFQAIVKGDTSRVGSLFLERSYHECTNSAEFIRELADLINKARGNQLTLRRVDVAELLSNLFSILSRHHVRLDASFSSVVLAIAVIEGLARTLNPDLDLLTRALPFLVLP